jgi:hypothetical protein
MEGFEDENPFEHEGNHITSENSSTSQVGLYDPPSPPHPSRQLSPTAPSLDRPPFPSPGSHRQPMVNYKTDFCCTRDRVLHSGEDVEILVRSAPAPTRLAFGMADMHLLSYQIVDAQKTSLNSSSPYITYVIRTGVCLCVGFYRV